MPGENQESEDLIEFLEAALLCVDLRSRCPANMAHIRQPRPVSSLGFQVKAITIFK